MKTSYEFLVTSAEVDLFADISGDYNPIHVDSEYSRRTIYGQRIVHGVLSALKALNQLSLLEAYEVKSLKIVFNQPVYIDVLYELFIEETVIDARIHLKKDGDLYISCFLEYSEGNYSYVEYKVVNSLERVPIVQKIESLDFIEHTEKLVLGIGLSSNFFYKGLGLKFGCQFLSLLLVSSRLIGMVVPGKNSLFTGIRVVGASNSLRPDEYCYSVDKMVLPGRPIQVNLSHGCFSAKLNSFFRPEAISSLSNNAILVNSKLREVLENETVWIFGGSKGLGEVATRFYCLHGARVFMTYYRGEAEANRILNDLISFGYSSLSIFQVDVLSDDSLNFFMSSVPLPSRILFFSSPVIKKSAKGYFNFDLYQLYLDYYAMSFYKIIKSVEKANVDCSVFYPSTVFLTRELGTHMEYCEAKRIGERIGELHNSGGSKLKVVNYRLEPFMTDQNNSILAGEDIQNLADFAVILNKFEKDII